MSGGRDAEAGEDDVVVVPSVPGRLIRPKDSGAGRRHRDDLDTLIDELLPDSTEGPSVVDAGLVVGGAALLGWSALGSAPAVVSVAGAVAIGLGCILPVRAAWRALAGRRRSRRSAALLARGVPLRVDHPSLSRLVAAYEALDGVPARPDVARAAAHGAVLEVASLLQGRTPGSERERNYVDVRADAVQELVQALQELGVVDGALDSDERPTAIPPDLVVEAREELDALGGVSALSRLDDVTEEVRARGRGG